MTTTTAHGTKTLPSQPRWNAGGALGLLGGLLIGPAMPSELFWTPALGPQNHAWAVTLLASAIIGGVAGMLAGGLLDHRDRKLETR